MFCLCLCFIPLKYILQRSFNFGKVLYTKVLLAGLTADN